MAMKLFHTASHSAARSLGTFGRRGSVAATPNDLKKAVAKIDRRSRRRISLDIHVRYLEQDGEEKEGRVLNIAASGVAIKSAHKPAIGSRVICHLDKMGGYQGIVCRHLENGFAVRFTAPPSVQERLIDRLMAAANNMLDEIREARRHDRLNIAQATYFELEDGSKHPCNILDISLSGIGVESVERPPLNSIVTVGLMRGKIVRHTPRGFGIELDRNHAAGDRPNQNLPNNIQRLLSGR